MTWRRAGIYWICFLALAAYYLTAVREPERPAGGAGPGVPVTRAPFIDVPATQISGLEARRADALTRCRRVDGRWRLVEPAGGSVPSDLVAALVANLTGVPDVQVVAEDAADLVQFGLDPAVSQLRLIRDAGRPITVRTGARNPAGTAIYAQLDDNPRIFLVGLSIRYYEDLLFEAAGVVTD